MCHAAPAQPGCGCWRGACLCHVSMHALAWRCKACCRVPECVMWPPETRGTPNRQLTATNRTVIMDAYVHI